MASVDLTQRKRLSDLNPIWIGAGGPGIIRTLDGASVPRREGVGVMFDCPCGCESPCYVPFSNPLDGDGPIQPEKATWSRMGDTFETLTLAPSIRRVGGCAWHGFIQDGGIVNAG